MKDLTLLEQRYERLNGRRPSVDVYLDRLEDELQVKLPDDFREIAKFSNGGGFFTMEMYEFTPSSVPDPIGETIRLRGQIDLPLEFVVLGEPPESFLVLSCNDGKVTWCDSIDAPNLGKGQPLRDPQVWNSFADFFAYLLDEEEAER